MTPMADSTPTTRFRFWLWLIRVIGVIVPRRLRSDWRQEWEAELRYRERLLEDWERLDRLGKLDLLWRSTSAFWDALWIQSYRWEGEMLQDLRYGVRMLRKNPGFTFVAVLTLSLGIGANTAIFSVVNGVLLNALPYPQPEQLTMVWPDTEGSASYPNFVEWRDRNHTFEGMAGMATRGFNLTDGGEPEEIRATRVSANFFQLMGVNPARGRGFTSEEDQPGRDGVVILSHGLWQRRFGGDPGILNQAISLNGIPNIVVGIMPPGFKFPEKTELWKPLAPNEGDRTSRGFLWFNVVGRLKPGVSRSAAQADLDVVAKQIASQLGPPKNRFVAGYYVEVVPLLEHTVGSIRRNLMILFGVVLLVLLIACANVANLLLARAASRQREVAVRAALGAGRWRIVRQLLTENLLVAVLGGALGVLLAWLGLRLLPDLSPANIPRLENIRLDGRVLWFTFALSLLTGLIVGLAPALQTTQIELSRTLKEGGSTGACGGRAQRIRGVFVVAEVALTLALLIGAGLLLRSFWRLQQVNPGFKTDHLLTLRLTLLRSKYPERQVAPFFEQLQERLSALHGVEAVSAATDRPHSGAFTVENRPPNEEELELPFSAVQPNYFQTMGIPLLKGRAFTVEDARGSPEVAIVNETFVNRYFLNEDPVGKRFTFGDAGPSAQWITIVGVVRDTRRRGLDQPIRLESWMPHTQRPLSSMEVVLRTTGDPLALSRAVREAVWSLDRSLPIPSIQTMEQILSESVALRRLNMLLLGLFALVALMLTAVGIYGVMSYAVTQRTHEIGIRMALGARGADMLRMVVWQGMSLALIGVALGLAAALALTRVMEHLLFNVKANDPATFAGISLLLISVALLAAYLPARRATKVDPMVALRHE
jgi:putative ABC transport system permease protein